MRKQRHPGPAAAQADESAESPSESDDLAAAVRQELLEANRLNTFYGRLAVELARRLAKPDETGASSLSKELRTVMEAALTGVKPPEPVDEPDEVEQARRRRQEMADRARQSAEQG